MVQYSSNKIVIAPAGSVATVADVSVSTTTTQLSSQTAKEVILQNIGDNNIRLGDSSITVSRGIQLKPNDTVILSVNNANLIYHRTESGSSTLTVTILNN